MTRPRRELFSLALAHDRRRHRCLWLPLGPLRIAFCARCLALYPLFFCVLAAQLLWRWPPPLGQAGEYAIALGLAAPALLDWGASRLGWAGHNALRLLTGALLGLALGRSFYFYLQHPQNELFWVQVGVLALGVVAIEVVRLSGIGEMLD